MHFERVHAVGVGFLENRTLELAPGLNVVHGPNEAGKSTWHASLLAGWLGLRRGRGAQRADDRDFHDRYRPWSGAALVAEVEVVTGDGRRLRFRHNLSDLADHEVTDGANRVVTGEYEQDGTADGAKLLGLTRDMAIATLCVSQAQVLRVLDGADGLHEQLQRAAATAGSGRGTAANAIERLERFRREAVGTDRVTAVRPLRRAIDALAEARDELRTAQAAHAEELALRRERDDVADRLAGLDRRREQLAQGIRAAEVAERRRELERLEALASTAAATGDRAPAEDHLLEQVRDALGRFTRRPPVPAAGPDPVALRAELDALPPEPEGEREPAPEVAAAQRAYDEALHRLRLHEEDADDEIPEAPELGDADPALLDEVAAVLDRPLPGPDPDLDRRLAEAEAAPAGEGLERGRWFVVAGAALLVLGAGGLAAGLTLAGALTLVAGAGLVVAGLLTARTARADAPARRAEIERLRLRRRAIEDERRRLDEDRDAGLQRLRARGVVLPEGNEVTPAMLRQLAERGRETRRAEVRRAQERVRRQELRGVVDRAAERLHAALDARDVAPDADADARYEAYLQACRARATQAALGARRPDLARQLETAERLAASNRAQAAEREDAGAALRAAVAAVGFTGSDPDEAAGFASEWLVGEQIARDRAAEAERAAAQLEAALGTGPSLEVLRDGVRAAEEALGAVVPVDDAPAADKELRALDQEVAGLRSHADQLDGRLAAARGASTPVTEAEERVALQEAELARVQRLDDTLRITADLLGQAQTRVQQDLAPVLRDGVLELLPTLTGGRYREVQVVPATLEVRVRTAAGAFRPASQLSHGTAEQVYLALRMVLADYLVTTGEVAPLVLDDVTVQFDEERTVRCLELLHSASGARQIVLFSQEQEVASWARAHLYGPRDRYQELPVEPSPSAGSVRA